VKGCKNRKGAWGVAKKRTKPKKRGKWKGLTSERAVPPRMRTLIKEGVHGKAGPNTGF